MRDGQQPESAYCGCVLVRCTAGGSAPAMIRGVDASVANQGTPSVAAVDFSITSSLLLRPPEPHVRLKIYVLNASLTI